MSCHEHAHLAYGYFLFDSEDWKIAERDFLPPWLDESDIFRSIHRRLLLADGMSESEYEEQKYHEDRLLMGRRNLGLDLFGHFERDGCAYFLHAGPVQQAYAYEPRPVSLDTPPGAVENLVWAISVLGITPIQETPQWMMYPSYK